LLVLPLNITQKRIWEETAIVSDPYLLNNTDLTLNCEWSEAKLGKEQ